MTKAEWTRDNWTRDDLIKINDSLLKLLIADPRKPIPGYTSHAAAVTGYQIGRDDERERIIKLLEDELWHHMVIQMTFPTKQAHSYDCIGCKQIALIKGGNK